MSTTSNSGDRQIAVNGRWAIAVDKVQWIVQRRRGDQWQALSFVSTTKEVLARCMREKGAAPDEISTLLAALPDCFRTEPEGDPWTDLDMYGVRFRKSPLPKPPPHSGRVKNTSPTPSPEALGYIAQIPDDFSIPEFLKRD